MGAFDDLIPNSQSSSAGAFDDLIPKAATPEGGFVAAAKQAVGAGIKGAGQVASDYIPGVTSANPVSAYGQSVIDANPTSVTNIGGILESPWQATKEAVGNAAGSMGSMLGARAIGTGITAAAPFTGPAAPFVAGAGQLIANVGPFVAAALPSYGGIREEQIKANPLNEADAKSKAIAALGAGTVGAIEGSFGPQAWALAAMKKGGIEEVAKKFADAKSITGAIGKGFVKGAAVEGAEEVVQNPIEQVASYRDPTTKDAISETLFGGAMGALGGGVAGGGISGVAYIASGPLSKAVAAAPGATVPPSVPVSGTGIQPQSPASPAGIASAAQFPQFTAPPQPVTGGAPLEQTPTAMPVPQATEAIGPQPGMVRYYHGGSPESVDGPLWFTSDLRDAKGWAARSPGMGLWYVDVPASHPSRGGDVQFGVLPPSRVELPKEISSLRKILPQQQADRASAAAQNAPAAPDSPSPVSAADPFPSAKQAEAAGAPIQQPQGPLPSANQTEVSIPPAQGPEAASLPAAAKPAKGIAAALQYPQQVTEGGAPLEQTPTAMSLGEFGKKTAVAPSQTPPAEPKSSEWVGASVVFTSPSGRAKRGSVIRVTNGKAVVVSPVGQNYVDLADLKRSKAESTPLKGFPANDNSPGNVKSLDYARQELEQGSPHWYVANALADDVLGDNSKLTSAAFSYVRDADNKKLWKLIDSVARQLGEGASNNGDVRRATADFVASQTTPDTPQQPATPAFDSDSFDKKRNETIKASLAAGNVHLDKLQPSVEAMRGKTIFYVHNPKQRGVIRAVDNSGNVYVYWADQYSADRESASKVEEPNKSWLKLKFPYWKSVENGKTFVFRSFLHSVDLKDYAVEKPQQPLSGAGERQPVASLQSAYNEAKAKLEAIGPEPRKPSPERQAFGTKGKAGAPADEVAKYEASVKAYVSWKAKYNRLKKAEVEASNALFAAKKAAPQPKSGQQSQPVPIMRRDDLVGAIMRVTGGDGINSNMALTIAGDTAGRGLSKLRGLFTNRGTIDLGEVATRLREDEGFGVRDGEHLSELIRAASFGDTAVSMERAERDQDTAEEKRHRDYIRQNAKKLKIKTVAVKFTDLEQRVIAALTRRHERAVELLDERAKKRFDAALEESYALLPEDVVDAVLVDVSGRGLSPREFWNQATETLRYMVADARAQKEQEALNAIEGAEPDWLKDDDGRGNQPAGGGKEVNRVSEEARGEAAVQAEGKGKYRYALVNRPASMGALPRGLQFTVEERPKAGSPHHEMARHGILVSSRKLTPEEMKSYELAVIADEESEGKLAAVIAADFKEYAEGWIEDQKDDPRGFSSAVGQAIEKASGGVRYSISDREKFAGKVLKLLKESVNQQAPRPSLDLAAQKSAAVERGSVGASLTKQQRKDVLKTLVDVYKANTAPRESKGFDRNGDEIFGYAYSPEYFVKSDITGKMVRYYVTLPDRRIAHPTELFPDYTQSNIDTELSRQLQEEKQAEYDKEDRKRRLESRKSDDIQSANRIFWQQNRGGNIEPPDTILYTDGKQFVRGLKASKDKDLPVLGEGWTVVPVPTFEESKAFDLAAQTPEEIAAAEAAAKAAEAKAEKEKKAADDAQKKAELTAEVKKRSEAAAETFELGGNAMDNLTGQKDIFAAPATAPIEPEEKPPVFNTEDAGSELTYNRRNRLTRGLKWDDIADKDEALRVKEVTKAKVYPKPDYQALIDSGVTPTDAYIIKLVYDSIAIKPNTRSAPSDADLRRYIDGVNRVMSDAVKWANDNTLSRASLLKSVYPNGWREGEDELRVVGGNKVLAALQPGYAETKRATKDIAAGWPASQEVWQRQGYKVINRSQVTIREQPQGREESPLWIIEIDGRYADYLTEKATVEEKFPFEWMVIDKYRNVKGAADTEAKAKESARALASRAAKTPTISDKGINVSAAVRTGADRRMPGEDISSDRLRETFKFKGVNFGNWMKGDANAQERQLHLNHAYDSFMDLAEVLDVPPEAMSLNGMLGVAIGAQGSGGFAAAHFVPGVNEINLTRESGAGSLAHEWAHALDHYFARQAGMARATDPFLTEHRGTAPGAGIRPEIVAKFDAIVQAMRKRSATPQEREAKAKKGIADAEVQIGRWLREPLIDRGLTDDAEVAQAVEKIKAGELGDGAVAVSSRSAVRSAVHDLAMLVKKKSGKKLSVDTMIGVNAQAERAKYLRGNLSGDAAHVPQQMVQTQYLDDAVKLDDAKGGKKYWSTSLEMFARAFDAFVSDELESKAAKNTYLSHAGRTGATVPKGDERTAISAAIKGLVDAVETKEGEDGNVALFSFAGQQSATADQFQLDRAKQLLADGANANAVRQQTGWFKGVDGKWRYEISDDSASLTMPYKTWSAMVTERNGGPMRYSEAEGTDKYPRVPLDAVIDHPALFTAYPKLRNVKVFYDLSLAAGQNAHIDHDKNEIGLNSWLTDEKILSSLLHEIQHGIQNVEGFASGGNLAMFGTQRKTFDTLKDADAFVKSLDDPYKARIVKGWTTGKIAVYVDGSSDPYRDYRRLAGEVESRNVQQRQNFPADRRKYSDPLGTQDVAPEDVIVVFNGKDAKDAPAPFNTTRASATAAVGASPADAAVFDMASEGKSAKEILSFLSKASRRPFNRVLAAALSRIGVSSTVSIDQAAGWRNNRGRNGAKFAASYSPKTDTVALYTPREAERHALHEFVHAASLKAIARGGPAARQMQAIFDYVQKTGTMSDQYGMGNFSRFQNETDAQFKKRALDEFTAELFTNPQFQVRLKQLPAPSGSKLKSAWDWVVRVIANMLGLRTKAQETALDRALSVGAALLQENAALTMPPVAGTRYHTTWHGSPHKFYTFDMSKIGTGEGAQAYGHGLYVAEAPEVAKDYQKNLSQFSRIYGNPIVGNKNISSGARAYLLAENADLQKAIQNARDAIVRRPDNELLPPILKELESLNPEAISKSSAGNFYKVDLPAEAVARMLDWDAGLHDNPMAVKIALEKDGWDTSAPDFDMDIDVMTGEDVIRELFDQLGSKQAVSDRLLSMGIVGTRYLDKDSRDKGKGTSNFVLFDDKLARIIEVNGVETGVQPWQPGEWEATQGGERFSQEQPFSPEDSDIRYSAEQQSPFNIEDVENLRKVSEGDQVDGRYVRKHIPNTDSISASLDDYTTIGVREVPMSMFDETYIKSINRKSVDQRTIRLVDEIEESGEINPLIVAVDSKGAYIIEGGHRFDALILSNANSVPALVVVDESDPPPNADIRYSLATNWQQSPVAPGNLYQAAKKKAASLLTPERLDKVIYEMQDKFVDLRRIRDHIKEIGGTITDLNDAYLGEELYHKRLAYRTEQFLKEELQPFFADMKARGVTMPEFEKFLHARHAPEANNEMAKRNPNQNQIDAGRQKSAATVRGLELNLQTAKARGLATVAIEKALTDARAELVRWNSAQAFKGTEAERLSLSGMSNADARALMASLTPAQRSNMDALAAKVDAINEGTLQTLERYGLMDKTALNTWRNTYKHYVPLHRDEAHPDSVSHPIGQGFNVRGDASKRRTGSNQEVTNIFSHIAMQREAALTRGEKNRVMQKLYLMARQNPIPEIWSVGKVPMIDTIDKATGFVRSVPDPQHKDKPNVITLRIAGKDVAIVMNEYNPQALRLAQSIKNLDVDDLHYLIPVVGKATRWFASINTQYNPIFGLINFARDVQTAALNLSTTEISGKQKEVFKDTMSILGDIIKNKGRMPTAGKWAPIYKEFNEVGGTTGYRDLFLTAEDRSKAVTDEIKALDRGKVSQVAHAVAGWLSDYNEAMENATRLAAYKAAIDNGMSKERAASLAKNLTVNFNRKGRQTRELGALYAFFNAAVQGTARMAQTLSGPAGKKIMLGGVLAGAASAMAGIAAMGGGDGEDDEWSKIPEFVKERSFIIPAGKDKYIAIPMPLGFHFLPNIGRLMVEMAVYKDKTLGKQMASLFTVLADAFNPLGGSAPPMQIIAPTVMDPFIALAQNKDWTGKPIYVENFNSLNPQPGSARAKDSATPIAKGMADIINSVTGGTKYVPGGWSPTPDQIDYVIGQLTGGIGREIGKLSSTIAAPFTGDELPAHKIPLLGRLYGSTAGATGQAGKFYENIKRANEVENELKGRRKDGIGVDDYLRENPKAVELAARGNAAERQIRALRQMRSRIVEAGGTDAAGKARQINERMATVMRGFNMQVERMQ